MTTIDSAEEFLRDLLRPAGLAAVPARQARLSPPVRELHRAVLRAFLEAGAAPRVEQLHRQARELDLDRRARWRSSPRVTWSTLLTGW